VSAAASAFAAAGFVLHDRPRVLSKRWTDLEWDPNMQALDDAGLVDYSSEASAVWVITERQHRKGRFPTARLIERSDSNSTWSELEVHMTVSPKGDIRVAAAVHRDRVDAGREVAVIIH